MTYKAKKHVRLKTGANTQESREIAEADELLSDLNSHDDQWTNNEWEREFLISLNDRLYVQGRALTTGQLEKLRELHKKYTSR